MSLQNNPRFSDLVAMARAEADGDAPFDTMTAFAREALGGAPTASDLCVLARGLCDEGMQLKSACGYAVDSFVRMRFFPSAPTHRIAVCPTDPGGPGRASVLRVERRGTSFVLEGVTSAYCAWGTPALFVCWDDAARQVGLLIPAQAPGCSLEADPGDVWALPARVRFEKCEVPISAIAREADAVNQVRRFLRLVTASGVLGCLRREGRTLVKRSHEMGSAGRKLAELQSFRIAWGTALVKLELLERWVVAATGTDGAAMDGLMSLHAAIAAVDAGLAWGELEGFGLKLAAGMGATLSSLASTWPLPLAYSLLTAAQLDRVG